MTKRKKLTEEELDRQNELALADPTLSVTAKGVEFCREWAAMYEDQAAEYEAKANSCRPAARGAYRSNRAQVLKARDAMIGNASFQLEWLRRHRPAIYDEIKKGEGS